MKKILLTLCISLLTIFNTLQAKDKNMNELDKKDKSIIEISALTTIGDTKNLEVALIDGLENGLTVNEIKEVLVQIYAYAGFPRSLGGIGTFMKVLDERKNEGIHDEVGKSASEVPAEYKKDKDLYGAKVRATLSGVDEIPKPSGYQLFSPRIDEFLKQHLFADIFVSDVLDYKQRELSTISVLSALGGVQGPLKYHLNASKNVGWTKEELEAFSKEVKKYISEEKYSQVKETLQDIN